MMKKLFNIKVALLALCLTGSVATYAQSYVWAKNLGGASTGLDQGTGIAVDTAGNVYTTGFFSGTADFDPGPGTFNLTSNGQYDIYISKVDARGNFLWARSMGGASSDQGLAITVDSASNVYVTGNFIGTVDFDPSTAGVYYLTVNGNNNIYQDMFVTKLDANGNFLWAKNMGGSGNEQGQSIVVDAAGNVYTTGDFTDTADFDPGAGVAPLHSHGIHDYDVFISKLDANGNYVWAKGIGGNGTENGYGITLDPAGNIYLAGYFNDTMDFDPGASTAYLYATGQPAPYSNYGTYDVFVAKYDPSGNYKWAKSMGGTATDQGRSVAVDAAGNVYSTGYFNGTVDFDPGTNTANLTSFGGNDIFISKLDTAGNYVWAKQIGGSGSDQALYMTVDAHGNVYTTGVFGGTADFDPSAGTATLTSHTIQDIFISKLDSAGKYVWAENWGATGSYCQGTSIAVGFAGNIYTTGLFSGTVDFDPGTSTANVLSNGGYDAFLLKLSCSDASLVTKTDTGCNSYLLNGLTYTESGIYTQVFTKPSGCDSIITLNLTVNYLLHPSITVDGFQLGTTSPYGTYQWYLNGNPIQGATDSIYAVSKNGKYTVVVGNHTNCSDTASYTVSNVDVKNIASLVQQIKIYPNPASDVVYIDAPLNVNVTITGMEGKIVKQVENTNRISIGSLAEGIYLLRITDKDGMLLKVEKMMHTK